MDHSVLCCDAGCHKLCRESKISLQRDVEARGVAWVHISSRNHYFLWSAAFRFNVYRMRECGAISNPQDQERTHYSPTATATGRMWTLRQTVSVCFVLDCVCDERQKKEKKKVKEGTEGGALGREQSVSECQGLLRPSGCTSLSLFTFSLPLPLLTLCLPLPLSVIYA